MINFELHDFSKTDILQERIAGFIEPNRRPAPFIKLQQQNVNPASQTPPTYTEKFISYIDTCRR